MGAPNVKLTPTDALLVVDVQRDFLPGGNLAVLGGDEVVPILNRYLALARGSRIPIFACRDWHPSEHCSFRSRGGPWPVHCVAGTRGAEFAPGLELGADTVIISKAMDENAEAYSAFGGTDLAVRLRKLGVKRVLVGGLTTDYCVVNTVCDARAAGFEVILLADAIRAVNLKPGDGQRAENRMRDAGAARIGIDDISP